MSAVPLPMVTPEQPLPARVTAMLNALKQQRDQTADEVVNLAGDLADMRDEMKQKDARIAELEAQISLQSNISDRV